MAVSETNEIVPSVTKKSIDYPPPKSTQFRDNPEKNLAANETPPDIADSSLFPSTLRWISTATSGTSGLHAVEEERAQNNNIASPSKWDRSASQKVSPEFESHYGLLQGSVRSVLEEILNEMAISRSIHSWDQKLFVSPIKQLEKTVRSSMKDRPDLNMSSVLPGAVVEAITKANGFIVRKSPLQSDVPGMLFLTQVR